MNASPMSEMIHAAAEPSGGAVPLQTIMVIVDPASAAQPALDKAVQVAMRFNSSLELYVGDVQQDLPESWVGEARSREYKDLMRTRAQDELRRLAAPVASLGLKVSTACEWDAPLQQSIGHHVCRTRPDLVVKERHRHARAGASVGRTDSMLMQHVPAALLLVQARPWRSPPRIAAAMDPANSPGSPPVLAERILTTGQGLANRLGGNIEIFHVAEGAVTDGLVGLVAAHSPDVLVMGASGPRSRHAPSGGTAGRVLTQVDCDVLVIRQESR